MSKVKIQGNASGTGIFTVAAPATNTDRTITLPDTSATLLAPDSTGSIQLDFAGSNNYLRFISSANYVGRNSSTGDIWLNAQGGQSVILGINGTSQLKVDGNGRVLMPSQPAFRAGNTAPDGDQSYGSQSKITHVNFAALNRGNCYDGANQRFVAPVSGVYFFIAHAWVLSGSSASFTVKVNGAFVQGGSGDSTTTNIASDQGQNAHHYSLLTYMNANDYAELWTRNVSMNVYKGHTWWQGYLVG